MIITCLDEYAHNTDFHTLQFTSYIIVHCPKSMPVYSSSLHDIYVQFMNTR